MSVDKDLIEKAYAVKIPSDRNIIYAVGHFTGSNNEDAEFDLINKECITPEGMGKYMAYILFPHHKNFCRKALKNWELDIEFDLPEKINEYDPLTEEEQEEFLTSGQEWVNTFREYQAGYPFHGYDKEE